MLWKTSWKVEPVATCKFCGKEMVGAASCVESHILIDGKKYSLVPYNKKSDNVFRKKNEVSRCPDCNVMYGGFHHLGCGMEICPECGNRWISCRCFGIKIKTGVQKECKIIPFKSRKRAAPKNWDANQAFGEVKYVGNHIGIIHNIVYILIPLDRV